MVWALRPTVIWTQTMQTMQPGLVPCQYFVLISQIFESIVILTRQETLKIKIKLVKFKNIRLGEVIINPYHNGSSHYHFADLINACDRNIYSWHIDEQPT